MYKSSKGFFFLIQKSECIINNWIEGNREWLKESRDVERKGKEDLWDFTWK